MIAKPDFSPPCKVWPPDYIYRTRSGNLAAIVGDDIHPDFVWVNVKSDKRWTAQRMRLDGLTEVTDSEA